MFKFHQLLLILIFESFSRTFSKKIFVTSDDFPVEKSCVNCLISTSILIALEAAFNDTDNCTIELLDAEYILRREDFKKYMNNNSEERLIFGNSHKLLKKSLSISGKKYEDSP